MKQSIKKNWVKALLSGKYKQGKDCLKKGNKFCCLGVLSDLYAKEHKEKWTLDKFENKYKLFKEGELLPSKVMKWAGLSRKNPKVVLTEEAKKKLRYDKEDKNVKEDLATINDEKCSFKVIADCINKSL